MTSKHPQAPDRYTWLCRTVEALCRGESVAADAGRIAFELVGLAEHEETRVLRLFTEVLTARLGADAEVDPAELLGMLRAQPSLWSVLVGRQDDCWRAARRAHRRSRPPPRPARTGCPGWSRLSRSTGGNRSPRAAGCR